MLNVEDGLSQLKGLSGSTDGGGVAVPSDTGGSGVNGPQSALQTVLSRHDVVDTLQTLEYHGGSAGILRNKKIRNQLC